jgi:D-3-phosphoglycerate dehydrogenase
MISLHVPFSNETRHFINARTLEQAKDGLILINTSRGGVVDERALASSLESGEVAAAGLDVFESEPLANEARLRKFPNVVLTPHIGAHTEEALARASEEAVSSLIAALTGDENHKGRINSIP